MAEVAKQSVYEQVIEVTYEYLGPAAKRFIDREVHAHLGKNPEKLTRSDVAKLHDWSKLAIALITEDTAIVDDFSRDMLAIAAGKRKEE